jgi:hypothetical protein
MKQTIRLMLFFCVLAFSSLAQVGYIGKRNEISTDVMSIPLYNSFQMEYKYALSKRAAVAFSYGKGTSEHAVNSSYFANNYIRIMPPHYNGDVIDLESKDIVSANAEADYSRWGIELLFATSSNMQLPVGYYFSYGFLRTKGTVTDRYVLRNYSSGVKTYIPYDMRSSLFYLTSAKEIALNDFITLNFGFNVGLSFVTLKLDERYDDLQNTNFIREDAPYSEIPSPLFSFRKRQFDSGDNKYQNVRFVIIPFVKLGYIFGGFRKNN